MHILAPQLILAISAACLTACGSGETVLVDAPQALTPDERNAFEVSKVSREEYGTPYGDIQPYRIIANGATLANTTREGGKWITRRDFRSLQPGMSTLSGHYTLTNSGQSYPVTIRSYQGFRSGTIISYDAPAGVVTYWGSYGIATPLATYPTAGQATYRGTAFDRQEEGMLTYHVDFAAKNGHGQIDGLSRYGTITLNNASLNPEDAASFGRGTASSAKGSSFDYAVGFFGNQAEEIAGYARNAQKEAVAFHGTRGAITE